MVFKGLLRGDIHGQAKRIQEPPPKIGENNLPLCILRTTRKDLGLRMRDKPPPFVIHPVYYDH